MKQEIDPIMVIKAMVMIFVVIYVGGYVGCEMVKEIIRFDITKFWLAMMYFPLHYIASMSIVFTELVNLGD